MVEGKRIASEGVTMKIEDPDADYDDLMTALARPHQSPDYHLCWLDNKELNLEQMEMRGYTPVNGAVADAKGGQSAKQLVKLGSMVLARLPRDVHEARLKKLADRKRRMQQTLKQRHVDEMGKAAASARVEEELSTGDIQEEVTRR